MMSLRHNLELCSNNNYNSYLWLQEKRQIGVALHHNANVAIVADFNHLGLAKCIAPSCQYGQPQALSVLPIFKLN